MSASPNGSAATALLEQIRQLHQRRESGVLRWEVADRTRRLLLRDGGVLLPARHGLARECERLRGAGTAATRGAWQPLLDRLAGAWAGDGAPRHVAFDRGVSQLPVDAVGPLPTACLLLSAYARGRIAVVPEEIVTRPPALAPPDGLQWTPAESWILERARQRIATAELRRESPLPAEELERTLGALLEMDYLAVAGKGRAPAPTDGVNRLAVALAARIGESLAAQPLALSTDEHREEIARRLAAAGEQDHFEFLEVANDASEEEIQAAFERLARRFHPDQARRLGLEEQRDSLSFLFERAVEAFRTLVDPLRRADYRRRLDISAPAPKLDPEQRRAEARLLARRQFERARFEISNGDLHSALQLLEQVVHVDPQAEYWAALGELQAQNPAWTGRAVASYRSALELDGRSSAYRYALGVLLERAGDAAQARAAYERAAAGAPPHPEAREALRRLADQAAQRRPAGGWRLGRRRSE